MTRVYARPDSTPVFPEVGPGEAITLGRAISLLDNTAVRVGYTAEIVQPLPYPPLLYLWTPARREPWTRHPIGSLLLERNGTFYRAETPPGDWHDVGRSAAGPVH